MKLDEESANALHMFYIVMNLQDAIAELSKYNFSKEEYLANKSFQNSTSFSAIQIGENVKGLSDDFRKEYNHIDWKGLSGLRDVYTHAYRRVDLHVAWNAIFIEFPPILESCIEICKKNNWEYPKESSIKKQTPMEKMLSIYDDLRDDAKPLQKFSDLFRKAKSLITSKIRY